MRKRIAWILAVCMAAALCACAGKPAEDTANGTETVTEEEASGDETAISTQETEVKDVTDSVDTAMTTPENAAEEAAEEIENIDGMPNPITEYTSLEEINKLTGARLSAPEGKEVTDERFSIIDTGDYQIAEYDFVMDGIPFCYRYAKGVVADISGIYVEDDTLFADNDDYGTEFKQYETGLGGRAFVDDGQYILTADTLDKMEMYDFQTLAIGLFNAASAESEGEENPLAAFEGSWHEEIAGRASMDITLDGEQANVMVNWPNSAAEVYIWEFTGTLNEDGAIDYQDGVRYSLLFDEDGNEKRTDLSKTDSGTLTINEEGKLVWADNESENPDDAVFARD